MKRKSDFITNSSSTNYIVIETWDLTSGDIKIYKDKFKRESMDITKKFIDFISSLNNDMNTFSVAVHDDHLQLAFGDDDEGNYEDIKISTGKGGKEVWLFTPDLTLNVYDDKSLECSFHYTSSHNAKELNEAIDLMITEFIKMLGITKPVEIEIERRVYECVGDGWDGGDPCFGYYGDSDKCKSEVECKRILTLNKDE